MEKTELKITYKVFLESEDISENRIITSKSFVRNFFDNCGNKYFKNVEIDDESDLEDLSLRLYVDQTIEEENCTSPEDANNFVMDMAEFLDTFAQAQSFMDMDGSFSVEYQGKKDSFTFRSEAGCDYCEIEEA